MVGTEKKTVTRYSQLKFARNILLLKEGKKKENLRNQFQKEPLLTNETWDGSDLLFLINILYNNDKTIPLKTLKQIGTANPQSLVRILVNDLLRIKPKRKINKADKKPKSKIRLGKGHSYFIKIALVGDEGVGKQTVRDSMLGRGFRTEHLMTIGADFASTEFEMKFKKELHKFTFQVWTLASQNYFKTVRQRFIRGVFAGLIIFDISNENSFMNLTKWIEELWKSCGRGIIPIAIVGNKSDLRHSNPQNYPLVERKRIMNYCEAISNKIGFPVPYIEISGIYKIGREEMLSFLAKATLYQLRISEFLPEQGKHMLITDHIFENLDI